IAGWLPLSPECAELGDVFLLSKKTARAPNKARIAPNMILFCFFMETNLAPLVGVETEYPRIGSGRQCEPDLYHARATAESCSAPLPEPEQEDSRVKEIPAIA